MEKQEFPKNQLKKNKATIKSFFCFVTIIMGQSSSLDDSIKTRWNQPPLNDIINHCDD